MQWPVSIHANPNRQQVSHVFISLPPQETPTDKISNEDVLLEWSFTLAVRSTWWTQDSFIPERRPESLPEVVDLILKRLINQFPMDVFSLDICETPVIFRLHDQTYRASYYQIMTTGNSEAAEAVADALVEVISAYAMDHR